MAERTLEERAAEAAKPVIDYDPGRLRKMCGSCHERVPTIYAADDEITNHANTCPSVVIPDLLAEVNRLHGQIREMVEKAADQKLDGYRELGERAAAAENRADALSARLKAAEKVIEALGVVDVEGLFGERVVVASLSPTNSPDAIAAFKRLKRLMVIADHAFIACHDSCKLNLDDICKIGNVHVCHAPDCGRPREDLASVIGAEEGR